MYDSLRDAPLDNIIYVIYFFANKGNEFGKFS